MTVNDNFGRIINNINNVKTANHSTNTRNNSKTAAQTKSFADVLRESVKTAGNNNSIKTETAAPVIDDSADNAINGLNLRQFQIGNGNVSSQGVQGLTFSKHAQQRLAQRNIDIAPELAAKLGGAVKKAYDKNIKNALILTDGAAFIVNTQSGVVVTTMNNSEMRDNIITNIDGTVIL